MAPIIVFWIPVRARTKKTAGGSVLRRCLLFIWIWISTGRCANSTDKIKGSLSGFGLGFDGGIQWSADKRVHGQTAELVTDWHSTFLLVRLFYTF